MTADTYDLGGAALVDNTNLKAVANAATRLTIAEATGGKGGFVYQQDTGELYYSNNGNFAGGGTLVGVIDSSRQHTVGLQLRAASSRSSSVIR